MKKIRVLVVEDSLTARKRLVEVLTSNPDVEVAGEAADGKRGIELCQQFRPDVVTLDMMLPVMSGLAATEYIMAYCPTPILIVSASTNRGEVFKTYDALAAGAVDVLEKPTGDELDGAWETEFMARVRMVSQIKVITHLRPRLAANGRGLAPAPVRPVRRIREGESYNVVAIGASTGGPAACIEILQNLSSDFPLPILLVIHIGSAFGTFLADWLDSQSELPVSYAQDGMALSQSAGGRVLMAPPDRHLIVCNEHLHLTCDPERHSCRPSVDILFESLAASMGRETIACLLTGMGRDGAQGLLAVREAGGRTLAQDAASSAVFGMPQEAIRLGAAQDVLPLHEFARALMSLASHAGKVRS